MIKTEIRIWLAHDPTLIEFWSQLEQDFKISIFIWMVLFEVYFNWPLESFKSDKNEQVMVFSCRLVGLPMLPRNSLQY